MTKLDASALRLYREARGEGWFPIAAIFLARGDQALRALDIGDEDTKPDGDESLRILWSYDMDYVPDGDYDTAEEAKKLSEGTWEVLGCSLERVQVPTCDHCGHPIGAPVWDHAASLWGIVLTNESYRANRLYRRSVEVDLAYEAEVIA